MKASRVRDDARKDELCNRLIYETHSVEEEINYLRTSRGICLDIVRLREVFVRLVVVDRRAFFGGEEHFPRAAEAGKIAAIHRERRLVHSLIGEHETLRALHEEIFFGHGGVAHRDGVLAERPKGTAHRKRAGDRVAVGVGVRDDGDVLCAFQHICDVLQPVLHFSSSVSSGMSMVLSSLSIFIP